MCWTFALSGGTSALLTILGAFNIVTCTAFARNLMIYHTALADYFMQATYPYRLWAQIILPLLSPVFFCVQLGAWCYLSAADEQIGWCLFAIFLLSGVLVLHGVVIVPQQYRLKSLACWAWPCFKAAKQSPLRRAASRELVKAAGQAQSSTTLGSYLKGYTWGS